MSIATYEGVVEEGVIRLKDGVALPEHAKVFVVVPDEVPLPRFSIPSPRLAHPEQFKEFEKIVVPKEPPGARLQ